MKSVLDSLTESVVTSGQKPAYMDKGLLQLIALVIDVSVSMADEKIREAAAGIRVLCNTLSDDDPHNGFRVCVIGFSDDAVLLHPFMVPGEMVGKLAEPQTVGRTNLASALVLAEETVRLFPNPEERPMLRPVVICATDAIVNEGQDPAPVARNLKTECDLVMAGVGSDADFDMLRDLATSPDHVYEAKDGKGLRRFLAAVARTLTTTMSRGEDSTQSMTEVC